MRIKLDENMPRALVSFLETAGHDVATVQGEGLSGADDPPVLREATVEGRALLTFDTGFADVRNYPIGSHAGIVVFRLQDQRWSILREPVQRLLESGLLDRLQGGLAIVDETRIRVRSGRKNDNL